MKKIIALTLLLISSKIQFAQNVGINSTGATPDVSAMLDIVKLDKGLLIPRVSLTGIADAITIATPATSLLVYNLATAGVSPNNVIPGYYYNSGTTVAPVWVRLATGNGSSWLITGNAGTNNPAAPVTYGTSLIAATENWIGTTDANDFVIGTNNLERMRVKQTSGNVGIGIAAPVYRLHVVDPAAAAYTTYSINTYVGNSDGRGVFGVSNNNPGYGYGGYFTGGYMGIRAIAGATTYTGAAYGVYSSSTGTAGTRYGGFFTASGAGTTSIGGYFSGSGGTSNYGIIVPSGGGFNGLGTTVPAYLLDVVGTGGANVEVRNNGRYWSNSSSGGLWLSDLSDCFIGNISATHFGFWSSGAGWSAMTIEKSTGHVGLGTTTPVVNLDISDASIGVITLYRGRNSTAVGTITQIGSVEYFQDQSSTIDFTGGSNFSINLNAAAAYDLQLAANSAAKPTSNAWTVASDGRLKEDVNAFKDGLSTLRAIKPIYFKYNGKAGMPQEYGVGVIAQELKEVAPYMVGSWQYADGKLSYEQQKASVETYLSVDNGAMTYVAINSIKELDAKQTKITETFKNISDFGVETLTSLEMFVSFSENFKNSISSIPVVALTTINSNASITIVNQTMNGFTMKINGTVQEVNFNWVAIAKVNSTILEIPENYTEEERNEMISKVKILDAKIQFDKEDAEIAKRKAEKVASDKNNVPNLLPADKSLLDKKVNPAINVDPERIK